MKWKKITVEFGKRQSICSGIYMCIHVHSSTDDPSVFLPYAQFTSFWFVYKDTNNLFPNPSCQVQLLFTHNIKEKKNYERTHVVTSLWNETWLNIGTNLWELTFLPHTSNATFVHHVRIAHVKSHWSLRVPLTQLRLAPGFHQTAHTGGEVWSTRDLMKSAKRGPAEWGSTGQPPIRQEGNPICLSPLAAADQVKTD